MAALALSLSFSSQLLSHQSITIINTATPLPLPPTTTTKPKFKKQKKQPKVKTHEGKIRDPRRGFLPQHCGSRIWPLWVFVVVGLGWDEHLSMWVFHFPCFSEGLFSGDSGSRSTLLCKSIVAAKMMKSMTATIAQPQATSPPPLPKPPQWSKPSKPLKWLDFLDFGWLFFFLNFGFIVVVVVMMVMVWWERS